jgi:hypothetical protein
MAKIAPSRLSGLIVVGTHGCTIYAAVVCSGDAGRVVSFDEDYLSETDQTLVEYYMQWLETEIALNETVRRLRNEGATAQTMSAAVRALLPRAEATRAGAEVERIIGCLTHA